MYPRVGLKADPRRGLSVNGKKWKYINTVSREKDQHCFVHNFYKFKHIVLIFGKQRHGCIAKLLL